MPEPIYHPWRVLAVDWAHIDLQHRVDLTPGRLGETDGRTWIRLRMPMLQVERRCTLAHELIHLERGDTGACSPADEHAIDREVARRLIPLAALIEGIRWTLDPAELADELWVTDKILAARFERMPEHEAHEVITAARDAHGERAAPGHRG